MKRIIVIIVAILSLSIVALSQGRLENVMVVVSGFEDNAQALAVISKEVQAKSKGSWRLVRSDPDMILRVTARTNKVQQWTEIDQKAAQKNAMLKAIEKESQRAVRRIRSRAGNGWLRIGAQFGRDIAVSRYVAPKYVVQKFQMAEYVSTVQLELIDIDTGKVISFSSGSDSVVLRGYSVAGQEPMIEIASGDLSSVLDAGESPGKQFRQLLALSAFVKASKEENQIGSESDRPVSRQRRAL